MPRSHGVSPFAILSTVLALSCSSSDDESETDADGAGGQVMAGAGGSSPDEPGGGAGGTVEPTDTGPTDGTGGASSASGSALIGVDGGSVASGDGSMVVQIPEGALDADVTITVDVDTTAPAGSIGPAFALGPDGTTFSNPVTLTFQFGGWDLGGAQPASLRVATVVDAAWEVLADSSVDETAQAVSATTTHFSTFAVVAAEPTPGGVDAGAGTGGDAGATDAGASSCNAAFCPALGSGIPCCMPNGSCGVDPGSGCTNGAAR